MDLRNLISRLEIAALLQVSPQTVAKWSRAKIFPQPKHRLSARLIYYDRREVEQALAERATRSRRA